MIDQHPEDTCDVDFSLHLWEPLTTEQYHGLLADYAVECSEADIVELRTTLEQPGRGSLAIVVWNMLTDLPVPHLATIIRPEVGVGQPFLWVGEGARLSETTPAEELPEGGPGDDPYDDGWEEPH